MTKTNLKIKIKTLAAESTFIRSEERKALDKARWCDGLKFVSFTDKNENPYYKMIRTQENMDLRKYVPDQYKRYTQLREHRIKNVREEARYSHLAYAYIRDKLYMDTETQVYAQPIDALRLAKMIHRFSTKQATVDDVTKWVQWTV